MKKKSLTIVGGLAAITALAIGSVVLYKKNIKKIDKEIEDVKKDFEKHGIDLNAVEEETLKIIKDDPNYGDIKRFHDLPIAHQIMRLLSNSTIWADDDFDWKKAVYSERGAMNSVHVVVKEGTSKDGFPDNKVGFFLEVPALYKREASNYKKDGDHINTLKYRNYIEYLSNVTHSFWERNRINCEDPSDRKIEIVGLYSKVTKLDDGLKVLRYEKIPDMTLENYSKHGNRNDGLYIYYTEAKKAAEENNDILPEDVDDIHLFMGVWFKMENPETNTYGITMKQILGFLEEMVINEDMEFNVEDDNHHNQQILGPIIIHPGTELEIILDEKLKENPIEFES